MKLLLCAVLFAAGLAFAFWGGDPNGHWCAQNFSADIIGGLVASIGVSWSVKS